MNPDHDFSGDAGNTAVEVLVIALVGGVLTVAFAFQAFGAQKASFAAHQLARQVVRLETLGIANEQTLTAMRGATAANLHINLDEVSVSYSQVGTVGTAVATVSGQTQTARMRLGD